MLPSAQPNPLAAILQGLAYSTAPNFPATGLASPYYSLALTYPQSALYYPQPSQTMNPFTGIFQNPAVRSALFASGGAALGSTVAGPIGGAIGAGAGPFVSNLFNQEKEPLRQVAIEAGLAALGGGLGSTLGPFGAAAGAGAGTYLGYQLNRPHTNGYRSM